jgi:hypothetical protein
MTGEAMIERIRALALELNLDPMKLLGSNASTNGITIEAEAVAVPEPQEEIA